MVDIDYEYISKILNTHIDENTLYLITETDIPQSLDLNEKIYIRKSIEQLNNKRKTLNTSSQLPQLQTAIDEQLIQQANKPIRNIIMNTNCCMHIDCYVELVNKCYTCKKLYCVAHLTERANYHYGSTVSNVSSDYDGHVSSTSTSFVSAVDKNMYCDNCTNAYKVKNKYIKEIGRTAPSDCCCLFFSIVICCPCAGDSYLYNKKLENAQMTFLTESAKYSNKSKEPITYDHPSNFIGNPNICSCCAQRTELRELRSQKYSFK